MKRRSFLALFGLAPAAAHAVPRIADEGNQTIRAPGADAASLERVRQELQELRQDIGPLAVQAIQGAKKRNVKGL